jgi:acetyl-CoA carboxylase biotin carboxyl carrier protein
MSLTQEDVAKILELIKNSPYDEMKLEMGDLKIVLNKQGTQSSTEFKSNSVTTVLDRTEEQDQTVPQTDTIVAKETVDSSVEENATAIPAPSAGLFYRAPSPGAPTFVEVGSMVSPGDELGIVEIMKLFISVKAEIKGRVVKICAENEQQVNTGQTLFYIQPE